MNIPYASGAPFLENLSIIPRDHIRGLIPLVPPATTLIGVATAVKVDPDSGLPVDVTTNTQLVQGYLDSIGPKILTYGTEDS